MTDKQPLILSNLPLEVRHRIFEYVAIRATKPKKLLRSWFENQETSELAAKYVAANPGCLSPIVVQPDGSYDSVDTDEERGDEDDYHEDEEGGDSGEDDDGDSGEDDDGGEDGDSEDYDEDGDSGVTDGMIYSNTMTQTLPPVPQFRPQRKWRHIPKFMRITQCPPPVEIFLACKQLNCEAKNWFYDVCVLHIEATGSFAHTSFFEEAFDQITNATFSPMENIRKVEVMFVWDTTWIRSDKTGFAQAIFPALLRQRADFVIKILAKAPNLKQAMIHWHDSAQDGESIDLMNNVLAGFLNLSANVKVEEHYISADTKPNSNSIAGKRRMEFQKIRENGFESIL